jgi:flagellar export protein FliJ
MAKFVYRLQKVFELRERKKKQQEQRVLEAQAALKAAELALEQHYQKAAELALFMKTAPTSMYQGYDNYKEVEKQQEDQLKLNIRMATDHLTHQKQLLIKAQADVEALVKHKEKAKEEWLEEEKYREMKQLDEVGGQRYFRQQQANALEALADEEAAALAEIADAADN